MRAHRGQGSQQPGRGGGTGHAPGARREPGPLRAAKHSRTSARGRQGAGCERADPRASRRGVGTRGRPRPPLGGRRSTARGFSLQSPLDLTGQGSVVRHGQQCPAPGHCRPQGQRQAGQPGGGEVDRGAPSRGPRAPMATAREAAGSAAGPPTGCRRKDLLPLSDAGPPGFRVAGPARSTLGLQPHPLAAHPQPCPTLGGGRPSTLSETAHHTSQTPTRCLATGPGHTLVTGRALGGPRRPRKRSRQAWQGIPAPWDPEVG